MKDLLFLHGALGAQTQFNTLKALLGNQCQIHTLNFEGHGDRPSGNPYSLDLFADNLKDYLNKHHLKKVLVFGYSMGGYVALKLAQHHPEYFERIMTLGTKFDWTPESAEREVKMLNPEKIEEKVPAFAKNLDQLHTATDWKTVMRKTADMMIRLGNGEANTDKDFQSIQVPCHLGVGDQDVMVSREETEKVVGLIPGAQFYQMENTKHPIDQLDFEQVAIVLLRMVNQDQNN